MFDLVVQNARLHTLASGLGRAPQRSFAVRDGHIAALDPPADAKSRAVLDARDQLVLPGFIDCHTHAVYTGDRMAEHAERLRGVSYAEIARRGGGIATTVGAVREASVETLVRESLPRLRALLREGVTTVEVKSGYGLELEAELRQLRAVARVRAELRMELVPTFLGLHAVPGGMAREDFVHEVVEHILPAVATEGLATSVDVFVESIGFTVADMERLFAAARRLGLAVKAHTDQLSNLGATRRAAELGALSCDHLEYSTEDDARAMGEHGTVAVLLPGAFYFLRETKLPPIDAFRRHGVPMAVATDLNPGSAPVASLLTAMHMATVLFGLSAEEAVLGATREAARALGRRDLGTLAVGNRADFTLWDLPGPEALVYQLGGVLPTAVYHRGQLA
jgi:imidazolonepropionase